MKPWLKYLLFGFSCYLIFVFVQMPASKVYYLIEDMLDEQDVPLEIFGISGSVWEGAASTLIFDGNRFDAVAWEFHPWDLLTGKASISIRFKGEKSTVKGLFSKTISGDLLVQNLQANIEATALLTLLKIPAIKLGGNLSLHLARLEFADKTVKFLHGRLLWSGAESKFPQKLVLDDLFADFSTTDDGIISAKLGDGGGALELNGTVSVAPDGKYDAKGLLSARAGRQSVLGRSLGFIGKYDSKGKASFDRTGNISEFGFLLK